MLQMKKGLSRHEGGIFERCPIYATKNHHLNKKSSKGKQEWEATYREASLPLRKLKTSPMKTMFASKVVLFKKTLKHAHTTQFVIVVNLCIYMLVFCLVQLGLL
jgi:hypothetical protein